MGILLKVLVLEKAEKGLENLKVNFIRRHKASRDKKTLLNREIEAHESLFDQTKLQLVPDIYLSYRPLKHFGLLYTGRDINRLRENYFKYILNDSEPDETGVFYQDKNGMNKTRQTYGDQLYSYSEALMRFNYLTWLKEFDNIHMPVQKTSELKLSEIALIYAYEGWRIVRGKNANDVALEYHYTSSNSGESLYNFFMKFSQGKNRTAIESTRKITENKIAKIENIIPYLSESAKKCANEELSIIKAKLRKEPV